LRIWIDGAPTGWDLDGWPGRALIEKWGAKGRDVALVAVAETLATLTFGQKLVIHGLLERCRTTLFAVQRLPAARTGGILAEVRSAQAAIAWASGAAETRIPQANWGRSATVVVGRMEAPPLPGRPVSLDELFPENAARAHLLKVTNEADGPIESFGSRFWTFVLGGKPEIGQLVKAGTPAQVIYQDRYLFSPLTVRLIQEILRPLAPKKDERANVMIRTQAAKAGLAASGPRLLVHDWESAPHRDHVLRAMVERLGFVCRLETRRIQELPHDRTLQIQWQGGGNVVLHLDQGLGFWNARQRLPFPFTARPEAQGAELAGLRFDVVHRQPQPMPIFILDVQLGKKVGA
jgi:DEAD/DEAH box helicase domain-containing protein